MQYLNFHGDCYHSPSDGEESVVGAVGHHLPALVGHVHIQVLHGREELHDIQLHIRLKTNVLQLSLVLLVLAFNALG